MAVLDTGVAPVPGLNQPDKVVVGPDLSFESQDVDTRYLDSYGHGMHMSGIIAGREVAGREVAAGSGAADAAPRIIAVGADDSRGTASAADDAVPSFSAVQGGIYGTRTPDVLAPGVGIVSLKVPGSTIATTYPSAAVASNFIRARGAFACSPVRVNRRAGDGGHRSAGGRPAIPGRCLELVVPILANRPVTKSTISPKSISPRAHDALTATFAVPDRNLLM